MKRRKFLASATLGATALMSARLSAADAATKSPARSAGATSYEEWLKARHKQVVPPAHIEAFLQTSLEEARSVVPLHEATLEPAGDGVIIRLNVECLDEAARYLIQLGCPFLVRQPDELRDVLRGLAAEIAQAAEPATEGGRRT